MTTLDRNRLITALNGAIRSGGQGGKTTAQDVRQFLETLIDEIIVQLAEQPTPPAIGLDSVLEEMLSPAVREKLNQEEHGVNVVQSVGQSAQDVMSQKAVSDELLTCARTTDSRLTDFRRRIFARNLNGAVYEGNPTTDPTSDKLHLAADAMGHHSLLEVKYVYNSSATINLQSGSWLMGNMRYFRLGGFNLNLAAQSGVKDLLIENYGDPAYVRSAYGANNRQTPRIVGCELYTPVKVEPGAFLRVIDCSIATDNWNIGEGGTIIVEGSTRYFGQPGTGAGYATIIDLR
ncbi:MAG TPA: hypothetical protein VF690_14960 [Hymenobacter sp.]|jgi:hypothetical protein